MKELLKVIVFALLNNDDFEIIEENESDKVVILKVIVNKDDIGKLIGKNGVVANSIRVLIKSASSKTNKRYIVKINEK